MADPQPVEAPRDFAAAVGKVVVTARMLFVYPVLLSWTERTPTVGEIVLVVVLAGLSLTALLRWRWMARFIRSHPIVLSLEILAAVSVMIPAGIDSPYLLYLSTSALLIGILTRGLGRTLLVVTLLLGYAISSLITTSLVTVTVPEEFLIRTGTSLGGLVLLSVLVYLGSTIDKLQDRVDRAVELATQNTREAALGEERSRVARELHDSTVKSLVGIRLLAKSSTMDSSRTESAVQLIADSAQMAIDDSRRILADLRTEEVPPLWPSIRRVGEELTALHGLPVSIEGDTTAEPTCRIRYGVRKVLEEALTNAALHSGAERVTVQAALAAEGLQIEVVDDGTGFDPGDAERGGHYGLAGMRERAAALDCLLRIDSAPDAGTTVRLTVPLALLETTSAEVPFGGAGPARLPAPAASESGQDAPAHAGAADLRTRTGT